MAIQKTKKKKSLNPDELLEYMNEEIEYDEENEYYKYATYNDELHCIYVNFNSIFERDDLSEFSVFKIHMRKFIKLIPLICDDLNYILNQNNDSARTLLNMNIKIALSEAKEKDYSSDEFKEDLCNLIDILIDDIKDYIDSTYCLELDNTNARINKDLQITDSMNKKIVSSAVCMRIFIPIINNYLLMDPDCEKDLVNKIFRKIIIKMSDNTEVALSKIERIVQSRVKSTGYSNKRIWKKIRDRGNDAETIILEIDTKLINSIIAKIEKDKSSIQYIDSVIKNMLDHLFTSNFSTDYKPLTAYENNDDSDERDRNNEFYFVSNKSEAELMLNRLTINQVINNFINVNELTEEDFEEFEKEALNGKNINNIQNFFMNNYYRGKNGGFNYLVTTEKQKKYLLWKMLYDLDDEGYEQMVMMLSSNLSDDEEPFVSTRSTKIKNARTYANIYEKYAPVIDIVEKDNFVIKAMSFRNLSYIDPISKENVDIDSNLISDEILKFFLNIAI